MTIIRNGVEIELTEQEIEQAYREREKHYHAEDVRGQWENMYDETCPCSDKDAIIIGERAQEILSKCDSYWDYYWGCFEAAIEEYRGHDENDYIPSSTAGDYSPSNPWDAPGMSIKDFIR